MRTFVDTAGRTWTVTLNVAVMKRVRDLAKVDLVAGATDGKVLENLTSDPVALCDVLYVVCKPEADKLGVCDEDFGRSMSGDVLESATNALLEELVDFFPPPKRRLLAKALARLRSLQGMVLDRAVQEIESDRLERKLKAEMEQAFGEASTNSPGSPASIPTPAPSVS